MKKACLPLAKNDFLWLFPLGGSFHQRRIISSQLIDWKGVLHANPDPNIMFDSFYSRISDIIDVHIPLIELSKRELRMKSKPWITNALGSQST